RRTQKTVLERAAEPTFPLAVEMHSRHRWLVHRDVARTVDLLLRGQLPRPQVRELDGDGRLQLSETPLPARDTPLPPAPPQRRPALAPVPLPDPHRPRGAGGTAARQRSETWIEAEAAAAAARDPAEAASNRGISDARPLLLCCAGINPVLLEQAIRSRRLPVQPIELVEEADALLAVRQGLSQTPELRRRAQAAGVPILVIKADTLPQIQRGLERLLQRHDSPADAGADEAPQDSDAEARSNDTHPGADDAQAALEECRLAVERLVLPEGRPVELLPRSEAVRQMQAELAARYQLSSAVFGSGRQQRLRIFPR
ncbi:MAG: AAA family ATPase, partial [Vulcanococcus sp.]